MIPSKSFVVRAGWYKSVLVDACGVISLSEFSGAFGSRQQLWGLG